MSLTRRRFLAASAGLPLVAPNFVGGAQNRTAREFKWSEKHPAEWNTKDIDLILNHSAWVREVPLEMDRTAAGLAKGAGPAGEVATQFKVLVRWESALPVRLARDRGARPEKSAAEYGLSISRLPLQFTAVALNGGVSSHSGETSRSKGEVSAQILNSTSLLRNGKGPVAATRAEWVDADFSTRIVISFAAAQQPIQLEDREVMFLAHIGSLAVRARFVLSGMVYEGRLDL